MDQLEKNKKIKESIIATRSKRKNQTCKVFRFKIDQSSLTRSQKESLKMFFIEVKRIYNYILSNKESNNIFSISYKDLKNISYLDKDKNTIPYTIQYVGSSIIADTISLMKESIKGLSTLKKNGGKVGRLRFKSECNSIRLNQYGITHEIRGNRIKVQGIKKPIRVNGLKQLRKYDNIDFTIAHLLYDGYDYFISLTCFIDKENKITNNNIIGIDLGCESSVTTSNGDKIRVIVEESERLKNLQRKLNGQIKHSNNYYKTLSKIRKERNKITNRKNDAANKIVNKLVQNTVVVIQNDQINEWKENKQLSKTVQHSIIGRIKSKLLRYNNVIVLDQWFPTSKHCFNCNNDVDLKLKDRIFHCPICGTTIDRDIHAAQNMIEFYKQIQSVGTTDLKLVRKYTYNIYKKLFKQEALKSSASE